MLTDDFEAVLYVKNPGPEKASFVGVIFYGREQYMLGARFVEPGETVAIDVRKLRDERVPDVFGNLLPTDLESGQFQWLRRSGPRMVGRIMIVGASKGISINMSCPQCPCQPGESYIDFDPQSLAAETGDVEAIEVWQTDVSCDYYPVEYPIPPSWVEEWTSTNQGVAFPYQPGIVTCSSPGVATIEGIDDFPVEIEQEQECEEEECEISCNTVNLPVYGYTDVAVRPTIDGDHTLWYFGGATPSGFATQVTLTSSGGGSTTWAVTAGANKINLSTTTGSQTTVTSTGSAFSSAVGDIKVTATVAGQASTPFSMTTRTPDRLVAGPINDSCDSTFGYLTRLSYDVQDQLLESLSGTVPLNEKWSTGVQNDLSGTNWRRGPEGSFNAPNGAFDDLIGGEALTLPPNPIPGCSGNSTAVQHWGQEWWVGSLTIGSGRRVQRNTLQKYKDFARHTGITSPAP